MFLNQELCANDIRLIPFAQSSLFKNIPSSIVFLVFKHFYLSLFPLQVFACGRESFAALYSSQVRHYAADIVQWPIFISGAKGDPSNYDGIFLGKLFCLILNQISLDHVKSLDILHKSQIYV